MNQYLISAAGLLSFLNIVCYASQVWRGRAAPASTASWLMWTVLDAVILVVTLAAGEPYALALGYTLGASIALAVHLARGAWKWTWVETACAVGAGAALLLWQTLDAWYGIVAGVTAMTLAGVPIARAMWQTPDRGSFWLFANTAVACSMTIVGTWPWTVGGSLLATGGLLFNVTVAAFTLRAPPVANAPNLAASP